MKIFDQDWWYTNTQGPFWGWTKVWSTLGLYAFGLGAFNVILAFTNPGFSITATLLILLGVLFVAITKEPWVYGKPTLVTVVIIMIIYWFLPGIVALVVFYTVPASILAGITYGVFRIIKYFKWYIRYRKSQKPTYIVHQVKGR